MTTTIQDWRQVVCFAVILEKLILLFLCKLQDKSIILIKSIDDVFGENILKDPVNRFLPLCVKCFDRLFG